MLNRTTAASKFRVAGAVAFTFAMALPAAATCTRYDAQLRDRGTSQVASVRTRAGQVEVERTKTGALNFYLRGERMTRTKASNPPKEARACVKQESRSGRKYKSKRRAVVVWVFCDDVARRCMAYVCVGSSCSFGGANY